MSRVFLSSKKHVISLPYLLPTLDTVLHSTKALEGQDKFQPPSLHSFPHSSSLGYLLSLLRPIPAPTPTLLHTDIQPAGPVRVETQPPALALAHGCRELKGRMTFCNLCAQSESFCNSLKGCPEC